MVGNTVRVTRPSRSRPRRVSVSMRCEMPPIERLSSLKRFGPSPSRVTTSTDHLSPTRPSTSLMARQSAGKGTGFRFIVASRLAPIPTNQSHPLRAAGDGDDAGARDFDQADWQHQVDEAFDLVGGAGD